MTMADILDYLALANSLPAGIEALSAGCSLLPGFVRHRKGPKAPPSLVQEQPGFHLGISPEIKATGRHAAHVALEKYQSWLAEGGKRGDTAFRREYFTIAVGGGNTVKNQYKALLKFHFDDINWLKHVRFFFLEETCNARNWESSRHALVTTLIEPMARRLIATEGARGLAVQLGLKSNASRRRIIEAVVDEMTFPIDVDEVESCIRRGDRKAARKKAAEEARRYQRLLRECLGPSMSFHLLISGFGKNGGIGAFPPYSPDLKKKKPAVITVENTDGPVSVALGRGVLTAADCISLIVSGSLKLRALGRFEMEDTASFEQTVMETPIRMLRETREIAEKVYIFADDRALLFEESTFRYQENGESIEVKSEVREGDEERGIHILLVHGFMGLYSYINLLIRLPSAWKVSAMRRGSHAKTLAKEEVFPHYANVLRKKILRNRRVNRPVPFCCHSMAGIISDHLLLSILDDYEDELPSIEQLKPEDRHLIEAIRVAGIVHIATWAPSDTCHISVNMENLKAHRKQGRPLSFSGPETIYNVSSEGLLQLNKQHAEGLRSSPRALEKLLAFRSTEMFVNGLTTTIRFIAGKVDMQKLMKQDAAPYGQRLLSDRVLKKVSFYGVLKEMNAAVHDPDAYQQRHLKALEAIIKYEIPYLAIIHRDDFMVSANRHLQEHQYLLRARLAKEGVKRESELQIPARLLLLKGDKEEPEVELVDPHFLILSHSHEGGVNARKVTAAMTAFVHENVALAIAEGRSEPLASIDAWRNKKTQSSGRK